MFFFFHCFLALCEGMKNKMSSVCSVSDPLCLVSDPLILFPRGLLWGSEYPCLHSVPSSHVLFATRALQVMTATSMGFESGI